MKYTQLQKISQISVTIETLSLELKESIRISIFGKRLLLSSNLLTPEHYENLRTFKDAFADIKYTTVKGNGVLNVWFDI